MTNPIRRGTLDEWMRDAVNVHRAENPLHDRIARLIAENLALREALEKLVDEQNGPPLLRYEDEWRKAYNEALRWCETRPTHPEAE